MSLLSTKEIRTAVDFALQDLVSRRDEKAMERLVKLRNTLSAHEMCEHGWRMDEECDECGRSVCPGCGAIFP